MTERTEIQKIEADDDTAFVAHASEALGEIKTILPENLHSLLLCAVTKNNEVKIGILGSDADIVKMLMTAATVARNSVAQSDSPSNPTDEVLH